MENNTKKKRKSSAVIIAEYEKKLYDLQQLLEISKSFSSVLEFSALVESILYVCMCQMRVLAAGMFCAEKLDSNDLSLSNNYTGFDLDQNIDYVLAEDHPLLDLLCSESKVFSVDELRALLPEGTDLSPIESLSPSLVVPMKYQNHLNGILVLGDQIDLGEGSSSFSDDDKRQILDIALLASMAINNTILIERSSTDMMTHLKLKYFFYKSLELKMELARTHGIPVSVIMFDVDFFKRFNDTYGHACGDIVLQRVAKIIQGGVREQDLAARYGGEEFVVMLYNTDASGADVVGERIRKIVESDDITYDGNHMQITISAGYAVFDPSDERYLELSPLQLVSLADKALYASKRNGRNRVTRADHKMLEEIQESDKQK